MQELENKIEELQRQLDARDDELALRGKSNDAALVETRRKVEEKVIFIFPFFTALLSSSTYFLGR